MILIILVRVGVVLVYSNFQWITIFNVDKDDKIFNNFNNTNKVCIFLYY